MLVLAPLLLAAAEPARVSDTAYLADCSSYATQEAYSCVAAHLQVSNDVRMMLELTTAQVAAAVACESPAQQ